MEHRQELHAVCNPRRVDLGGRRRIKKNILAGALAVAWNMVHALIVQGLIFGAGIIETYTRLIERGAALFGLSVSSVVVVLLALLALHMVVGGTAGLLAWQAGRSVLARRAAVSSDEEVST
jgi:hypothetical protein